MNRKLSLSGVLASCAILIFTYIAFSDSIYQNIFLAAGLSFLFTSWLSANYERKQELIRRNLWELQQKVMIASSLVALLGLTMFGFYESQMPKYQVAGLNQNFYTVPPQLNKKQLYELGAECNTYGNTLCSYGVFAKIVKLDPRDYLALGNLAMAQSHLKFDKYAVENFKTAINNGAGSYDIYKFYGRSLLRLGIKQQAIEAFEKSLSINPNQTALSEKLATLKAEI